MEITDCRRINEIKEEKLLVIKILRGEGTSVDMCRNVNQYYQKKNDGEYYLLFEDDPCK